MSQVMRAVEVKERDGQIQKKLDDEVKKKKAGAGAAAAADSPYKLRNLCNLHKLTFVYCSMFLSFAALATDLGNLGGDTSSE